MRLSTKFRRGNDVAARHLVERATEQLLHDVGSAERQRLWHFAAFRSVPAGCPSVRTAELGLNDTVLPLAECSGRPSLALPEISAVRLLTKR